MGTNLTVAEKDDQQSSSDEEMVLNKVYGEIYDKLEERGISLDMLDEKKFRTVELSQDHFEIEFPGYVITCKYNKESEEKRLILAISNYKDYEPAYVYPDEMDKFIDELVEHLH